MTKRKLFAVYTALFASLLNINASDKDPNLKAKICFTENKGQVSDQFLNPRTDVLFGGIDGSLSFHLKNNGISYQLTRINAWKEDEIFTQMLSGIPEEFPKNRVDNFTIYRIDIDWLNCNPKARVQRENQVQGYSNYYLPVCPNGALEVAAYEQIIYENIYEGIDLKWYQKDGHLKYDYILAAGAGYKKIKLQIKGAQKLAINSQGELLITTPLGQLVEEAPMVTQNGKTLESKWLLSGNTVSFHIPDYDPSLPLLIDPGVRIWGTYYGGSANDLIWASTMDPSGNMFTSGYTSSVGGTIIATAGAHQTAHSGNGLENALLVKWTQAGVRIWGTYYGGNVRDLGLGCAVDPAGNVFLSGNTISNNVNSIATAGAHQTTPGGSWDAYIVKFNSAGVRQWGTYYGGSDIDFGNFCAADAQGNSYLCGKVGNTPASVVATPGSHQNTYGGNEDAFLVKFSPSGTRLWGTYYGGEGADVANYATTDAFGNIYMVGASSSTVGIATPGAHQANFAGGNYDGFLVKFNNSGVRLWSTYYGGALDDRAMGFVRDPATGNLYVGGYTSSDSGSGIATDGSHQSTYGGGLFDGFLVQFTSLGVRQWGTYYGGSGDDRCNGVALNAYGYPYMAGYTNSGTGTVIATPGSLQTTFGGGPFDAFLAQFNAQGNRVWATYYGGNNFDLGQGCATDNNSNVYLVGLTDCPTLPIIATVGAHQTTYGGSTSDGFFVKFYDCTAPPSPANGTSPANQFICEGNISTLTAGGTGTISWFNLPSGGSTIGTGNNFITPVLSAGTYSYYAQANTCTNSAMRTLISLTVNPLPIINVTTSNSLLCIGSSATLSASGVATQTWNTGANTSSILISPTVTTSYTITGTDNNGCENSSSITQEVINCTVGLKSLSSNGPRIAAYPNPATSVVFLKGVDAHAYIVVYNSLGQTVASDYNLNLKNEIPLNAYPNGMYFIKVVQDHHQEFIKVIKK